MAQLTEGRSRDHCANLRKGSIWTSAASGSGEAEPDSSAALFHTPRKSTVIDDLAANCRDPTRTRQRLGPDQDAYSSRSGGTAMGIGDPLGRIKLREKEHKGGNQQFFGKSLAMKLYHE